MSLDFELKGLRESLEFEKREAREFRRKWAGAKFELQAIESVIQEETGISGEGGAHLAVLRLIGAYKKLLEGATSEGGTK